MQKNSRKNTGNYRADEVEILQEYFSYVWLMTESFILFFKKTKKHPVEYYTHKWECLLKQVFHTITHMQKQMPIMPISATLTFIHAQCLKAFS